MIKAAKTAIPAVAYYRMSTDRQETSIRDQRSAVERYALERGYKILREYIDEGISGDATHKRKGFLKMIADSERGEFSAILVWDMDRFGRFDSIEAGRWVYPLRANGIHLATIGQGLIDWADFAGRLMYGIQTEAKHQFLRDLSRNVTRGMTRLAEQGKWAGGAAPFGYRLENKRLVLGSDEHIAVVRRIYSGYLQGVSLRALADELTQLGVPSARGKGWVANGIYGILRNRAYVGDLIYNRRNQSRYKPRNGGQVNAETEWIIFEKQHEAIIDRATFDRVQDQLASRRTCSTPRKNGGDFVLSGLIRCGKCGYGMTGRVCHDVPTYQCYGHLQHGPCTCDRNILRQDDLVAGIVDALERKYFNAATLEKLAAECRRQLRGNEAKRDASKARTELVAVDSKLEKAKRRLVEVDADMLDEVQAQIRELKARRDVLAAAVKESEQSPADRSEAIDSRVGAALSWIANFKAAMEKADPVRVRAFLREAVEKVEVWAKKERWTAKRFKYRLERGAIYLKGWNLSSTACRT